MAIRLLPNGLWSIEPRRREFFGLVQQFIAPGNAIVAGSFGNRDTVNVDGQADYLSYATAAFATAAGGVPEETKVQLITEPDKYWFQAPVFLDMLGSGQFPAWFPAPMPVPRAQSLSLVADDRRTVQVGNIDLRVLHIGQKVYDRPFEGPKVYRDVLPFDFVANFTADDGGNGPIGASVALPFPVNIFSDADFDIYKMVVLADGDATIQVQTTGKSLDWFNRPCHVALLGASAMGAPISSGQWPFRLPNPVRVPASGSILTTVANLTAATNRVQVIFRGLRMRPAGGLSGIDPRLLAQPNAVRGV